MCVQVGTFESESFSCLEKPGRGRTVVVNCKGASILFMGRILPIIQSSAEYTPSLLKNRNKDYLK